MRSLVGQSTRADSSRVSSRQTQNGAQLMAASAKHKAWSNLARLSAHARTECCANRSPRRPETGMEGAPADIRWLEWNPRGAEGDGEHDEQRGLDRRNKCTCAAGQREVNRSAAATSPERSRSATATPAAGRERKFAGSRRLIRRARRLACCGAQTPVGSVAAVGVRRPITTRKHVERLS
jgi:hypothetical protein